MTSTSPENGAVDWVDQHARRRIVFKTYSATAQNPCTHPSKLGSIAHLDNESLWRVLIVNPSTNADTLRYIYKGFSAYERSNSSVAKPLASHLNTPEDVLVAVAESKSDAAITAMTHPNITFPTLRVWVMDGNDRFIYFWNWMFYRFPEETSDFVVNRMVQHVGEDLREALQNLPLDFLLEQYAELFYPNRPAFVKPFALNTISRVTHPESS